MSVNKHALIKNLHQIGAFQFGHYTLKSGQNTSIYINLRKIISYPALLKEVSAAYWDVLESETFDFVCGVPYTALPIASTITTTHDVPMVMRRRERKDYGTKQSIEGDFKPGQSCVVIEDVITSGASILETVDDLKAAGLNISLVIALIGREPNFPMLDAYRTHVIFSLVDIFNALKNQSFSPEEQIVITQLKQKFA